MRMFTSTANTLIFHSKNFTKLLPATIQKTNFFVNNPQTKLYSSTKQSIIQLVFNNRSLYNCFDSCYGGRWHNGSIVRDFLRKTKSTTLCCHLSTKPNVDQDLRKKTRKNNLKFRTDKARFEFSKYSVFEDNNNQQFHNATTVVSNKVYTVPNVLCMLRIGITPVVGSLIVAQNYEYALALCAVSSVTDFLDGWIARTFNSESKLGAVLDPLADKLLVATLTFTLAYVQLIPLWLAALILTRDSLIIMGGLYMRFRSITPPINWNKFFDITTFKSDRFKPTLISKVNTGFQLSLVLVTLASPIFSTFFAEYHYLLTSLQLATGATTLWSGLNYLTRLA